MVEQSAAEAKRAARREVDYEDVDDVIGIAAEMQSLDADRLSVEELEAVAKDLEIPAQYVGPAVVELRRRRALKLAHDAKKKKTRLLTIGVVAGVVVLLVLWAVIGQRGLAARMSEAEAARAQVKNVVAYRERVVALWQGQPTTREHTAALAGADNRVALESKRYATAAAEYNEAARGFPGSLWASLFGMPGALPTSVDEAW